MNRRDVMKMGAAAAGALVGGGVFANSEPLKVLIFGGTGFIGPHFVRVLRESGHKLTLFNRGKRNPGLFPDIETLIGDRNGKIDALKGRDWDVVIDDSGYFPAQVRATAELLRDRVAALHLRFEHLRIRGSDAARHRRGLPARAAYGSGRETDYRRELWRSQGGVRTDR